MYMSVDKLLREHMKQEPNIGGDQVEWIMWNEDLELIEEALERLDAERRLKDLYVRYGL